MSEFFFPAVGAFSVFFVVIPGLSVLAKLLLWLLPSRRSSLDAHAGPLRLVLILGPVLGPVIWLTSASIHQSEAGAALAVCVVDHLDEKVCHDVVLFGLTLLLVLATSGLRRAFIGERRQFSEGSDIDQARGWARLEQICVCDPHLRQIAKRVRFVNQGCAPICTRGWFRPRIEIELQLLGRLDDDELKAALLHESEHARALDPLRFFVAQVTLSVNPARVLVGGELARYHFAREALCDRWAVQRGADPLALARSIVAVGMARGNGAVAALGGVGAQGIALRVQLLINYAEKKPEPTRTTAPLCTGTPLVSLLAAWPHVAGAGWFDIFHHSIERAALLLGLG